MKHWRDESMNPESMTQWSSESANPWINEIINASMNRWINGSMNQWMSEAMNRRINEWTNERVERWMNGRIVSEVLLCWATSELSDLFAQPSLLSATSSLSSLLSGTLLRFPATRVFSSHNVRTGTSPHRSGADRDASVFYISFFAKSSSLALFRPHLSKVLQSLQFLNTFKRKWSSRYSPVRFLSTTFPDRGPQPPKHRPYFCDPQPRCPKKRTVPAPRVFALVNSHASELLNLPATWWWVVDMMMCLTWWCGWHDGGNADHDNRPYSEVL